MAESDPVLARMLAKVAAWQAAVDSYRAAKALEQGGLDGDADLAGANRAPLELPVNAFRGMTIPEAIKLYLRSVRRKQTAQEIAEGLKAGGIASTARDFAPTVRSSLNWLKRKEELLRFKDGWDLAEAHSTAFRNRLAKDAPKSKARKGAATAKKARPTKATKARSGKSKPQKGDTPKGPSLDDRVQAFLRSRPMEWFTRQQVAEGIKEPNSIVLGLAFARLVKYGRVAKQDDGRYAAVKA